MWDDIERQAEICRLALRSNGSITSSHFLGAVVLNVAKVTGRGLARSEIIDGQQRLTTLQLVLAALRDFARAVEDDVADDVERLTFNPVKDETSEQRFKVWPTNSDRDVFRHIMTAGSVSALIGGSNLSAPQAHARMAEAYAFFYDRVAAYANDETVDEVGSRTVREERLYALVHAFKTSLQVVVIELEERDDPQIIFETLNARGQPLLPSDLIRNILFLEASNKGEDVDRLYTEYWSEFDQRRSSAPSNKGEDRFWHVEERQGRLLRPRIDLFMLHDLTVRTGRELNVGQLFREFRTWFGQSSMSSEDYLRSIKSRSSDFANLLEPDGIGRLSVFAQRLKSLDTSTVYPVLILLMELSRSGLPISEQNKIVVDLESYLVRRFICGLTTRNYNSFFLGVLRRMLDATASKQNLAATVREELLRPAGPAGIWPSDDEFEHGQPIYVKSRSDRAAFVLLALNSFLTSSKSEGVRTDHGLSVEHLLPQRADGALYPYPSLDDLPLGVDFNMEKRRQRLRDTVGNLTLLTQPLNSSVSNGAFATKVREICDHSDLRLNAMFRRPEQLPPIWDEKCILARGRYLFESAKNLWPRPLPESAPGYRLKS